VEKKKVHCVTAMIAAIPTSKLPRDSSLVRIEDLDTDSVFATKTSRFNLKAHLCLRGALQLAPLFHFILSSKLSPSQARVAGVYYNKAGLAVGILTTCYDHGHVSRAT